MSRDHRLGHGDAREASLYERLRLPGELARLMLTDVPYNVANVGHVTTNAGSRVRVSPRRDELQGIRPVNRQWMEADLARLVDSGLFAASSSISARPSTTPGARCMKEGIVWAKSIFALVSIAGRNSPGPCLFWSLAIPV
jgi:hypothetical protein